MLTKLRHAQPSPELNCLVPFLRGQKAINNIELKSEVERLINELGPLLFWKQKGLEFK